MTPSQPHAGVVDAQGDGPTQAPTRIESEHLWSGTTHVAPGGQRSVGAHCSGARHPGSPKGTAPGGQTHAPAMHDAVASSPSAPQQPCGVARHVEQDFVVTVPFGHVHAPPTQSGADDWGSPQAATHEKSSTDGHGPASAGGDSTVSSPPHPAITTTSAAGRSPSAAHVAGHSVTVVGRRAASRK